MSRLPRVLPLLMVRIAPVVGAVIVTLFTVVAVTVEMFTVPVQVIDAAQLKLDTAAELFRLALAKARA